MLNRSLLGEIRSASCARPQYAATFEPPKAAIELVKREFIFQPEIKTVGETSPFLFLFYNSIFFSIPRPDPEDIKKSTLHYNIFFGFDSVNVIAKEIISKNTFSIISFFCRQLLSLSTSLQKLLSLFVGGCSAGAISYRIRTAVSTYPLSHLNEWIKKQTYSFRLQTGFWCRRFWLHHWSTTQFHRVLVIVLALRSRPGNYQSRSDHSRGRRRTSHAALSGQELGYVRMLQILYM